MSLPPNVAILAFEGPDAYSMVGGLGVRVTQLADALGDAGIRTELYFVGAPDAPATEMRSTNVRLRRWCQWISRYHPGNVYDGEGDKIYDYANSVPPAISAEVVAAARNRGERVLIMGEDWQIAPAMIQLDADLRRWDLRDNATLLWNANNTYGFDGIDWAKLTAAARVTAVSKYMKFELALRGVPSLVIPNGIPADLPKAYDAAAVRKLRSAFSAERVLLKVGRFDPDKRWLQAIDAVADMRAGGANVQLIVRGGRESYRSTIFERAQIRGLRWTRIAPASGTPKEVARELRGVDADVVEIANFLPNATLYALYGAVDAVLANSGREPFGLVGLEVMAARGIPVCGSTGEDYARPFDNAIVCDTDDPRELVAYLDRVFSDDDLSDAIRKSARATALHYTWPSVLKVLAAKLEF